MTREHLIERLAAELTRVVGALLETATTQRPAKARGEAGFGVSIMAAGDVHFGELQVSVARPGAQALAATLHGEAGMPTDSVVLDTLEEVCQQALAALDAAEVGATLTVARRGVIATLPDPLSGTALEIVGAGREEHLYVTIAGDLAITADRSQPARSKTLDVIMDIDLPLVVRFGRTTLPLRALTALGPGSVIDLGRSPDDPVDVLISNRVVARGEVVIVAGNYGVRVRDVVSPAERARSLEAELA
jgi:flagellar motor switch protein FliN